MLIKLLCVYLNSLRQLVIDMSITAIVVDDEPLARKRLTRLLGELDVNVIAQGCNGQEAVELTSQHNVDLIFLDINMPIQNGLSAASDIVEQHEQPPAIVFCTAYDEYALEAFSTDATAYLLKPVSQADLSEAICKAQRVTRVQIEQLLNQQNSSVKIAIKRGSVTENIAADQLVYFHAVEKNVYAKQVDHPEMLVDYTLKEVEALLKDSFVRTHRSCLVNKSCIEKLIREDTGSARVQLAHTEKEFDVSRRHLSEVKKCFQ